MKKNHSAEWHRHQVYDTIEWQMFNKYDNELIVSGRGRIGLQYGLNKAFEITDEIVVHVKDVVAAPNNNGNSGSSSDESGDAQAS
jgi:hypothetical protein